MALISRNLLRARPQELGKIKIGGKGRVVRSSKGTEFRPPVKFDHFVITTRERDQAENFQRDKAIHAKIGDKPTELEAYLMFDKPEENFHAEMTQYKGRGKDGKVWTCDGETAINLRTNKQGTCPRAAGRECQCKPYGRLHLQLLASPHTMGYHVFRTTSWESVNNIQSSLEEIFARFGTCYQAPVKLVMYPSEDRHDGGVSTSYKVGLVLAVPMVDAAKAMRAVHEQLRIAAPTLKALAAGVVEDQTRADESSVSDIAEEFFPDEVQKQALTEALNGPEKTTAAMPPASAPAQSAQAAVEPTVVEAQVEEADEDTDEEEHDDDDLFDFLDDDNGGKK